MIAQRSEEHFCSHGRCNNEQRRERTETEKERRIKKRSFLKKSRSFPAFSRHAVRHSSARRMHCASRAPCGSSHRPQATGAHRATDCDCGRKKTLRDVADGVCHFPISPLCPFFPPISPSLSLPPSFTVTMARPAVLAAVLAVLCTGAHAREFFWKGQTTEFDKVRPLLLFFFSSSFFSPCVLLAHADASRPPARAPSPTTGRT